MTHRSDWGLTLYIMLICCVFAGILALAITYSPGETFITDDWHEAAKYELACEGHTNVVRNYETGTFEVTCRRR